MFVTSFEHGGIVNERDTQLLRILVCELERMTNSAFFRVTGVLIFMMGISACSPLGVGNGTTVLLTVNYHKVECQGVGLQLCMLVKEVDETDYTYMYGTPEGFGYEWGYVYEILLEEEEVSDPPADAPSIRRILREVVSQEWVGEGTRFEIVLSATEGRISAVSQDRYRFYDEAEFTCDGATCEELAALIEAGGRARYSFELGAEVTDALRLVEWESCDINLAGSQNCIEFGSPMR